MMPPHCPTPQPVGAAPGHPPGPCGAGRGRRAAGVLPLAVFACLAGAAPAEVSASRGAELEHLLIQDCGSCHGLTLKGGLGSPLTREALEGAAPESLAVIILDGVPGTAMPPWRPLLTEDEALWLADYLLRTENTQ